MAIGRNALAGFRKDNILPLPGLFPAEAQASEPLSQDWRRGVPGLCYAMCCDALLSPQIHSGTLPASPSAWTPVSTAVCSAAPRLPGGGGQRSGQP